jgi:hypothetical protein
MPILQKLHEEYAGEHFVLIGVSDEAPRTIASYLQALPSEQAVTYPTYWDARGQLGRRLEVKNIPFTVFIGPDGKVRGNVTGELTLSEGRERIEKLIALARAWEPPPRPQANGQSP